MGASFCAACGVPLMEGITLPSTLLDSGGVAMGQDLDIPDWLKGVAAETPVAATAGATRLSAAPLLPAGFVVAGVTASAAGGSQATMAVAHRVRAERPMVVPFRPIAPGDDDSSTGNDRSLPPIPDGGLATAMPTWLRAAPTGAPLSARPATAAPAGAEPTGFISGDDLPVWVRDLVAKEEAETEESRRVAAAAEQSRVEAEAAAARAAADAQSRRLTDPTKVGLAGSGAWAWMNRTESADRDRDRSAMFTDSAEHRSPWHCADPLVATGGDGLAAVASTADPATLEGAAGAGLAAPVVKRKAKATRQPKRSAPAREQDPNLLPILVVVALLAMALALYLLTSGLI